jgi:hypothetical protein
MSDESSGGMFLRLPPDLRQWVAHEALVGRRSMNAVVVEAVDFLKSTRTDQLADDQHAAAIKRAISVAHLPRGTAIILQSHDPALKTDVLIKAAADADYSLLARVRGEEVTFADDPAPTITGDAG